MVKQYRKKSVCIEAIQWDGGNDDEIASFVGKMFEKTVTQIGIQTLEGFMKMTIGDFIIKGVHGEFNPCKPEIFEKTYELVGDA